MKEFVSFIWLATPVLLIFIAAVKPKRFHLIFAPSTGWGRAGFYGMALLVVVAQLLWMSYSTEVFGSPIFDMFSLGIAGWVWGRVIYFTLNNDFESKQSETPAGE